MSSNKKWRRQRLIAALPKFLASKAPSNVDSFGELRRRRLVVTAISLAGTGLLGASLSTKPGSARFYGLTLGVAATWVLGGLGSGPVHLESTTQPDYLRHRSVAVPILLGVGAFGGFYGCALVARRIPVLNRAIAGVLQYAHQGATSGVFLTTLANGAAEEVFFRGALYNVAGNHPVVVSTAAYSLATTATRNPALVLASAVMGTLFGLQRRATGGIQAPIVTHLTWSALMLRFLPPLFRDDET